MKKITSILMMAMVFFTLQQTLIAQNLLPRVESLIKGNGVPASPTQIAYLQPDGSLIHIYLKGDGAVHWAVTEDGYTLISGVDGYYRYAVNDEKGDLVSSEIVAHDQELRSIQENSLLSVTKKGIEFTEDQIVSKLKNYSGNYKGNSKSFPASGTPNNLVLLVDFSDMSCSYQLTDFDNLMNEPNYGGVGSFKDFYYQNSNGKLSVNTVVSGIYTASNTHDYYGQNDGAGNDMNVVELVNEMIGGLDATVDFSQFDNDGDGVVDCLYFIYAGTGEASSGAPNDIWPHNNPNIAPITVDGVTINSYTCSNELAPDGTTIAGIGTICHEFGHALGLPDFYDTDYAGSGGQAEGTGTWDVMSNGNSNGNEASPAMHNPFSKQMLNWQQPKTIALADSYTLPASETDTLVYLVEAAGALEGFCLENRQQIGFDNALSNHGLLIYHYDVDYINNHLGTNNLNADPLHQGFDIEEADNETTDPSGDTYPGSTSNTSFTDITTPGSILWTGLDLGYPIINIVENISPNDITFDIGGLAGILAPHSLSDLLVYPTLTNGLINIKSSNPVRNVSVSNAQGKLVMEEEWSDRQNNLDVSILENGTYVLTISTDTNIKSTKIVILK